MKIIDVVCGIMKEDEGYLIARRGKGVHENVWEFPGGKVEPGESREAAIIRELKEELDIEVEVEGYVTSVVDKREDCELHVHAYRCHRISGDITLHVHHELRYVKGSELASYGFEECDKQIIQLILQQDKEGCS